MGVEIQHWNLKSQYAQFILPKVTTRPGLRVGEKIHLEWVWQCLYLCRTDKNFGRNCSIR